MDRDPAARHGLKGSKKSPTINWQLDADYIDRLGDEEARLLSEFLDEFYMSSSSRGIQTRDQLRERWRAYKANQFDAMSYHGVGGSLISVEESGAVGHIEEKVINRIARAELAEWLAA